MTDKVSCPSRKSEALKLAHNALTFAKPMIGALCADSPTADLREKRNKVYAKVEAALEAVIEEMKESAPSEKVAQSASSAEKLTETETAHVLDKLDRAEGRWADLTDLFKTRVGDSLEVLDAIREALKDGPKETVLDLVNGYIDRARDDLASLYSDNAKSVSSAERKANDQ